MSVMEIAGVIGRAIVAFFRLGLAAPIAFVLLFSVVLDWFDRVRGAWLEPQEDENFLTAAGDDIVSIITITMAHAGLFGWWWWALAYFTWKLVRIQRPFWVGEVRGRWLQELTDDILKWAPFHLGLLLYFGSVTNGVIGDAVARFAQQAALGAGGNPVNAETFSFYINLIFTLPFVAYLLFAALDQTWVKSRETFATHGAAGGYLAFVDNIVAGVCMILILIGSWWTLPAILGYLLWKATYMRSIPSWSEPWLIAIAEDLRFTAALLIPMLLMYNVVGGPSLQENMQNFWAYLTGDFQPPPLIDFSGTFNPGQSAPPSGPILTQPGSVPTIMPVVPIDPAVPTAVPTPPLGELVPVNPNQPMPSSAP